MNREDFIAGYCERSRVSREQFDAVGYVAIPCRNCDYPQCRGWQVVSRESLTNPMNRPLLIMGGFNDDEIALIQAGRFEELGS